MSNRVRWAGLYAVPTKDAAAVVDVVDGCITLTAADASLIGVLGSFDVDAIRGAGRGTQEARDAFFQTVLVALKNVNSAVPLLEVRRCIRVILRQGRLHHFLERDAHPFGDGCRRSDDLIDLRHLVLSLD